MYLYRLEGVKKTRTKGGVSFTLSVPYLEIERGEFLAVVGPSGCGKSTLLDILALVLKPTSFKVFSLCFSKGIFGAKSFSSLDDNDISRLRGHNIGYILQSGGLLPFLTVEENILLTAQISGKGISKTRFNGLIERLGLKAQLNKKPQHLSGGQRQRVAVARALIHEPQVLLADEPTASVDYPTALEIIGELKDLARENGATIVMVTHDKNLVSRLSHREVSFSLDKRGPFHTVSTAFVNERKAAGPWGP